MYEEDKPFDWNAPKNIQTGVIETSKRTGENALTLANRVHELFNGDPGQASPDQDVENAAQDIGIAAGAAAYTLEAIALVKGSEVFASQLTAFWQSGNPTGEIAAAGVIAGSVILIGSKGPEMAKVLLTAGPAAAAAVEDLSRDILYRYQDSQRWSVIREWMSSEGILTQKQLEKRDLADAQKLGM